MSCSLSTTASIFPNKRDVVARGLSVFHLHFDLKNFRHFQVLFLFEVELSFFLLKVHVPPRSIHLWLNLHCRPCLHHYLCHCYHWSQFCHHLNHSGWQVCHCHFWQPHFWPHFWRFFKELEWFGSVFN